MVNRAGDTFGQAAPETVPSRDWWVVLLWGVAAFLLGLLLLVRPGITTLTLVRVMAIFWLVGGFFDVLGALLYREEGSGARLLLGVISMIASYYTQENSSLLFNNLSEVIHQRCDGLKINIQLKILHATVHLPREAAATTE